MAISLVKNHSQESNKIQMYLRDFKDQKVLESKTLKHKKVNYQIKLDKKKKKRMN
jgi:hypothetical protein